MSINSPLTQKAQNQSLSVNKSVLNLYFDGFHNKTTNTKHSNNTTITKKYQNKSLLQKSFEEDLLSSQLNLNNINIRKKIQNLKQNKSVLFQQKAPSLPSLFQQIAPEQNNESSKKDESLKKEEQNIHINNNNNNTKDDDELVTTMANLNQQKQKLNQILNSRKFTSSTTANILHQPLSTLIMANQQDSFLKQKLMIQTISQCKMQSLLEADRMTLAQSQRDLSYNKSNRDELRMYNQFYKTKSKAGREHQKEINFKESLVEPAVNINFAQSSKQMSQPNQININVSKINDKTTTVNQNEVVVPPFQDTLLEIIDKFNWDRDHAFFYNDEKKQQKAELKSEFKKEENSLKSAYDQDQQRSELESRFMQQVVSNLFDDLKSVHPNYKTATPTGRAEILLLEKWLLRSLKEIREMDMSEVMSDQKDKMEEHMKIGKKAETLESHLSEQSMEVKWRTEIRSKAEQIKLKMADQVFTLCINEVIRQSNFLCKEQGEFLQAIFFNYFKLVRQHYNHSRLELSQQKDNFEADFISLNGKFKYHLNKKNKIIFDKCEEILQLKKNIEMLEWQRQEQVKRENETINENAQTKKIAEFLKKLCLKFKKQNKAYIIELDSHRNHYQILKEKLFEHDVEKLSMLIKKKNMPFESESKDKIPATNQFIKIESDVKQVDTEQPTRYNDAQVFGDIANLEYDSDIEAKDLSLNSEERSINSEQEQEIADLLEGKGLTNDQFSIQTNAETKAEADLLIKEVKENQLQYKVTFNKETDIDHAYFLAMYSDCVETQTDLSLIGDIKFKAITCQDELNEALADYAFKKNFLTSNPQQGESNQSNQFQSAQLNLLVDKQQEIQSRIIKNKDKNEPQQQNVFLKRKLELFIKQMDLPQSEKEKMMNELEKSVQDQNDNEEEKISDDQRKKFKRSSTRKNSRPLSTTLRGQDEINDKVNAKGQEKIGEIQQQKQQQQKIRNIQSGTNVNRRISQTMLSVETGRNKKQNDKIIVETEEEESSPLLKMQQINKPASLSVSTINYSRKASMRSQVSIESNTNFEGIEIEKSVSNSLDKSANQTQSEKQELQILPLQAEAQALQSQQAQQHQQQQELSTTAQQLLMSLGAGSSSGSNSGIDEKQLLGLVNILRMQSSKYSEVMQNFNYQSMVTHELVAFCRKAMELLANQVKHNEFTKLSQELGGLVAKLPDDQLLKQQKRLEEQEKSYNKRVLQNAKAKRKRILIARAPNLGNLQHVNFDKTTHSGFIIVKKLQSLQDRSSFTKTPLMPLKSVLKQVSQLYDEKMQAAMREMDMEVFVFNQFLHRYGFKQTAEQKFTLFCLSLKQNLNVMRVNLFARFMQLLDEQHNYSTLELKKYLEAVQFMTITCKTGIGIQFNESDSKRCVPYIRAFEYIKVFSENRLTAVEQAELRAELDKMVEPDPKKINQHGIIDIDTFLMRLIKRYKMILSRTKDYVIEAFKSADLDGNQMCDHNEFLMLFRYIQAAKFQLMGGTTPTNSIQATYPSMILPIQPTITVAQIDNVIASISSTSLKTQAQREEVAEQAVLAIYYDQADLVVHGQKKMSFDKFTAVCVDYNLFSENDQNHFLGIESDMEVKPKFAQLRSEWVKEKYRLTSSLQRIEDYLEAEELETWNDIISHLDERVLHFTEGQWLSPKSILLANKVAQLELARLNCIKDLAEQDLAEQEIIKQDFSKKDNPQFTQQSYLVINDVASNSNAQQPNSQQHSTSNNSNRSDYSADVTLT